MGGPTPRSHPCVQSFTWEPTSLEQRRPLDGCATSGRMNTLARAVATLALVLFTACGPPTLAKATVERSAMDSLSKATGMMAPQITCPNDLVATVGASMVCAITLSDNKVYDVTVTVTGVMDTTATYSVVVASMPRP
jgi:hypothetical protein